MEATQIKKTSSPPPSIIPSLPTPSLPYASLELQHQLNTYLNTDDISKQDPAVHFNGQVGSILYDGILDLYLTLGVIKKPRTQAFDKKRTKLSANFYILKSPFFKVRQYHMWTLPDSQNHRNQSYDSRWEEELHRKGIVYQIGINPELMYTGTYKKISFEISNGVDVNTHFYTQRQYMTLETDFIKNPITFEDYVPRIGSVEYLNLILKSSLLNGFKIEQSIFYRNYYFPHYYFSNELGLNYTYKSDRASFYKLRIHYQINNRLIFAYDFFDYKNNFFKSNRKGKEKRYKNIFRVSCML